MAFKFKVNQGVHVRQDIFDKLCEARNMRLHGEIQFIDCHADRFEVRKSDGSVETFKAYGDEPSSVRLCNLLNADIQAEPARREAYLAAKASDVKSEKSKPDTGKPSVRPFIPRGERFAREDAENAKFKGARI